LILNKKY